MIRASDEEIDYQTYYDCSQVVIEETDTSLGAYCKVRNAEDNSFMFLARVTLKDVQANHTVNIRKTPSINAESIGELDTQKCVLEVARSSKGWSIIILDNEWYFIWSEYIDYVEDGSDEVITTIDGLNNMTYWGNCRISSYCYNCNTPSHSYKSSVSGWPCSEWQTCAANGIAIGTKLYVEGYGEFIVNDRGPSAMNGGHWIDLFVDCSDCHIWCHADVWIIE